MKGRVFFRHLLIIYLCLFTFFADKSLTFASDIENPDPDIDQKIERFIYAFALRPLTPPSASKKNLKIFYLGKKLFFEKDLSGNKNIACVSCHQPSLGTGDALPLSLGEGAGFEGARKYQNQGKIIRRNSPALYNLSEFDLERPLFWDGRVRYNSRFKIYETPLDHNSQMTSSPEYQRILKDVSSPLAMQALFPLVDQDEMLGDKGENDLANLINPLKVWDGILKRILAIDSYKKLVQEAYPNTSTPELNIGHLVSAMAHYITYNFQATDTPYDRYLHGQKNALNEQEKRGLMVFLDSGRCVQCHNGPQLSDFSFINIGIPVLEREGFKPWNDFGRHNLTSNDYQDLHRFRTAPLRNIALTMPYMHNGVFSNLRDVINHYDNPVKSLTNYVYTERENSSYRDQIIVSPDFYILQNLQAVDLRISGQMDLTEQEKKDLEVFLRNSLTQLDGPY